MSKRSPLERFEDHYWSLHDQDVQQRHRLAMPFVREEPVLDIGGGDGLFLDLLRREKGFTRLTSIDVSRVAIAKARKKGIDARRADLSGRLPFADGSFATVCALDVLEHVHDPASLLSEMKRIGRTVVLAVPNFHYWKDRLNMLAGNVPFQCKPQRGHIYWFNYGILNRMAKEAGLRIESIAFNGFRRLGPVGPWLARAYPNIFADSFVAHLAS